jgi:UPF0148 protein
LEEEDALKKISKFLEQGCTMLATHHSCGAPLFRCKGKIICPVCSSPEADKNESVVKLALEEKLTQDNSGNLKSKTKITSSMYGETNRQIVSGEEVYSTKQTLKIALIRKLKDLQMKMDEEKDPDQVYRILKCIGEILSILKILE